MRSEGVQRTTTFVALGGVLSTLGPLKVSQTLTLRSFDDANDVKGVKNSTLGLLK